MIEEEQLQTELFSDENQNSKQSEETKQVEVYKKQKGTIFKQKRKYRKRLIWIPLITRNIIKDNEPVFIFNLFKMMRSYENEEIEKYQNYGIQDAGIGQFDVIKYDKVNQSIDISLNTSFYGQVDLNSLILLYKSYQNQQYYDLALVLEEYQKYINAVSSQLRTISNQQSDQMQKDEEISMLERAVKEWANANLENELYEIVLGDIDYQKKTPSLKKIIFSKNLILFIGEELEQTYNLISLQRKLDFLTNFFKRRQQINGEFEIERTINLLKNVIKKQPSYNIEDQIVTIDGYTIPTKKTHYTQFYDPSSGIISSNISNYFFTVSQYSFEPQWIKYLIDQRSLKNNLMLQPSDNQQFMFSQPIEQNLDEICQKEYFLEKFKYIQPNQINQIDCETDQNISWQK